MVKTSKIICLLFFLLTFVINTFGCDACEWISKLGNGEIISAQDFLEKGKHIVFFLGASGVLQITYRHFCERNPESEKLEIEKEKFLNEKRELENRKLEQEIAYNDNPEVQKNKIKLLAAEAALQSESRWIEQKLQERRQEQDNKDMEQRIILLQEIDKIESLKSDDSSDDDDREVYSLIKSALLNKYSKLLR